MCFVSQVYSVSAVSSIAIVYDRNPAFGNIALADYPLTEMTLSLTFESSDLAAALDSEYYVYVDVGMKQAILDVARVEIRFLNNDFTFTSTCSTGSHSTNPYIPELSTSLYSCEYDSINNVVVYTIGRTVAVNDMFRFIVTVHNPAYVSTLGQIQVRTMHSSVNTIVEMQESGRVFNVEQITFASQNMQLGWGLEYSASSASFYPFNLQVLRQSASSSYIPYNAFQWIMKISADLPDSALVQVEIQVPNKLKTFILPGSISHTLPYYVGLSVTCYLNTLSDPTAATIICKNVGKMYASIEYQIGCRITFPYDLFTSPLEPNFGTITLYSIDVDTGEKIGEALSESKNPLSVVSTDNNPTWALSSNNLDYTVFSTAGISDSVTSANLNTLGAIPSSSSGSLQQFIFTMKIPLATITSTVGSISTGAGIIILANPKVISLSMDDSPSVSTYNDALLTSSIGLYSTVQISERASYSKIKVYATQSTDLSILLDGTGTNTFFKIKRGKVLRHTSYYADQNLMDFYIATFDQINSDMPIYKQIFLYNGYTINVGGLLKLRYGVSNYWSNTVTSMDGSKVPVFLRIAGYFNAADLGSARTKIAIFFKNIEPFYQNSDYTINNKISCFSSLSYAYSCSYFSSGMYLNGQSITNYNRIEITLDKIPTGSNEKFQLIIPMKSFVNMYTENVSIYLGGLQSSSIYTTSTNLNSITALYRLTGKSNIASQQLFTLLPTTLAKDYTTSATFGWTVPSSARIGATGVQLTLNAGNSFVAGNTVKNNVNIPNLNGASFTVCSEWNFVTTSSTLEFALSFSDNTGSCLSFSYANSFTGTTPNYRYGVYCPFEQSMVTTSTTMRITNSFLSYTNGRMPPAAMAFGWSHNDGLISALQSVTSSYSQMSIGKITIPALTRPLIKSRSKEYLLVSFITQNPIRSGNQITISILGFAADFTLESTVMECYIIEESTSLLLLTTCTRSLSGSNLNILISSCSNCLTQGGSTYTLRVYGILMAANAGILSRRFGMTIYATSVASVALIVDQSTSSNNQQDLFYQVSATTTDPEIVFSDLEMGCTNKRCRTYMYFTITFMRRMVAVDEQIVLSLGGYAKDNTVYQSNLQCRVNDSDPAYVSFLWLTMDTQSLSQIFLVPKTEIPESSSFTIYCDGIRTPYSTNPTQISGFVASQGSVSDIYYGYLPSASYLPITPQILFPANNLILTSKLHNTQGSSVQFMLTIISTKIALSSSSFIYLNFPTTFLPWLTSKYIYCLMNSIFVDCQIPEPYTVVITNLPVAVPIGTSFVIQVFGLDQSGIVSNDYLSVYVGISNQATYRTLDEAGDVEDLTPSNPPDRIFISKMDVTNHYIRSTATYSLRVRLPAGSILAGNYLYVDFPKVWDRIVNYVTPICTLKNPANTTDYSGDCSTFGNRITFPILTTDANANNYYYLTIEDLRNPDMQACSAQEIIISVSADSGSTVSARSAPSMWNINGLSFSKNPDQINLKWIDSTTLLEISQVTAYIGVFNNQVTLASDYGSFVKAFTIYTPNSQFYVDPASPAAVLGYPNAQFSIAGSKSITQGLFLVQMQKTDDQDAQTNLPFLKVQVKQTKFTISISGITFRIPKSGHSLPLTIDMESCQSLYDSLFTGTLFDPTTPLVSAAGLSFVNRSSLVLNYLAPKGFFMVASNENSVDPAGTGQIKLQLSALTLTYYNNLPTISYAVVPNKSTNPIAKINTILTADKGATYMYIEGLCNQESIFYYLLSTEGARGLTALQIIQGAWTWRTPSFTDPYHYHFGFSNIFMTLADEALVTTFNMQRMKVSNLRPSTVYNVTGFCMNGNDMKSPSITQLAATKGNSGIFLTISFTFSEVIKQDMAQQLACYLVVFFKIPAPYLRTEYDDYCNLTSGRRFLKLDTPDDNDEQDDDDDDYESNIENFSDSSIRRHLASSGSTSTKMYIYPISEFEKDTTTPNIQIVGFDSDLLIDYAYNNVTGLPAITSIGQPTLGDYIAPDFVNQTDYTATPSLTSVSVSGFLCDKQCLFYILIDLKTKDSPTFYDIRTGYNGTTKSPTFRYASAVFTKTALSFEFKTLQQNTEYNVYYYAAADDPSITSPRSNINSFTFKTSSTETTHAKTLTFASSILFLLLFFNAII